MSEQLERSTDTPAEENAVSELAMDAASTSFNRSNSRLTGPRAFPTSSGTARPAKFGRTRC